MSSYPPSPSANPERTLQDLAPFTAAELVVLRAAALGDIAKVSYDRPGFASPDTRLRAEFLARLACGGEVGGVHVRGRRLQVVGAYVMGSLDVRGIAVPVGLWLGRCSFEYEPLFDGAHVFGSLGFSDCTLPGFGAEGCRIDGGLALSSGCAVAGNLRLSRARIGRDLVLDGLAMGGVPENPSPRFVADDAQIGGDVVLEGGVETLGEVRLTGARIGGSVRASGARMTAAVNAAGQRGIAFNLDRTRIGGSVRLDQDFASSGSVTLRHARIHGNLDLCGASLDTTGDANWSTHGGTLVLDGARIEGALMLRDLYAPLQGASLVDAQVGSLDDDLSSWGGQLALDGFDYRRFAPGAPTDASTRVAWLARQRPAVPGADDTPDPWWRLARTLRRAGHAQSALAVEIARERHLRQAGRIGHGTPRPLRWLPRGIHAAWGASAAYGHRPVRPWMLAAVVWLGCALVFYAGAAGLATPAQALHFSMSQLLPGPGATMRPQWLGRDLAVLAHGEAVVGWLLAFAWLSTLHTGASAQGRLRR